MIRLARAAMAGWCLAPLALHAQAPLPAAVEVLVLPQAGDPLTAAPVVAPLTVPIGVVAGGTIVGNSRCGLTTAGVEALTDPTAVSFDDPYRAGTWCSVPLPSGLPPGTGYRAALVALADQCAAPGCRSARAVAASPFAITAQDPPAQKRTLTIAQQLIASFVVSDARGNPARIDGVPQWASSNTDVATVTPSGDGLSAVIRALQAGTASISVTVDADLGAGVRPLIGTGDIEVQAGVAEVIRLVFGQATDP